MRIRAAAGSAASTSIERCSGRVAVDEGDRGVEVRREDDPPCSREGALEDVAALEARQKVAISRLDGVGEGRVGRHEDGRRVGAVLGLRDEVRGDETRVGGAVGEDHPLRRSGREVDADDRR